MNLKAEQQRLCDRLPGDARCFVRVCDSDEALWVCDLPRRYGAPLAEVERTLGQSGFACHLDEKSRLWYLDFSPSRWDEVLLCFPAELPAFPLQDRYHAAYALCRLWLLHPTGWTAQQLPLIRRMLKLTSQPEDRLLQAIPALHEQAAQALRRGEACAYAAGCILARWLMERREME